VQNLDKESSRLEGLIYEYIDTGWFDRDRAKTTEAMGKAFLRIPRAIWDEMPMMTIFAPSPKKLGEVYPYGPQGRLFLYLSPGLENQPQDEVDFAVAHEFAHIALGHYSPEKWMLPEDLAAKIQYHEDVPNEIEADKLTESWGFRKPTHLLGKM
jgi:hypothetical protein